MSCGFVDVYAHVPRPSLCITVLSAYTIISNVDYHGLVLVRSQWLCGESRETSLRATTFRRVDVRVPEGP